MSSSEVIKPIERSNFSYRCIKKEFYKPIPSEVITKQFHLELGEKYETIIVEDRKTDWLELANKDLDQCGLANVLKLAQKGLVDTSSLAFSDDEALDLGGLDPMDPSSVNKVISSQAENVKKLEAIAAKVGCSVDELITSTLQGTIADLIAQKMSENTEKKEEKENA